MAKTIIFTSKGKVNGKDFKKGDELSVSDSLFKVLTEDEKCAKEKVSKKKKGE